MCARLWRSVSIVLAMLSLALVLGGAQTSFAAPPGTTPGIKPGTVPKGFQGAPQNLQTGPFATVGLSVIYQNYGLYRTSVSAAGSNDASHLIVASKPHKDATVVKAYLMAASNFSTVIANGDITFDGHAMTWSKSVFNGLSGSSDTFFNNVLADVTTIVKAKMDAFHAVGTRNFRIVENAAKNSGIDGEILAVIYKVPSGKLQSVAILFGGQQLAGDRFELNLTKPIDPAGAGAVLNMGLGISFSYQENGTQQYSIVNVNGKRLSTSAGGSDDGVPANGGLITVGGLGDSIGTPTNPNATPTNARSDDEKYSLLKYITKTTTIVNVDTSNPSNDDNIFMAWFEFTSEGEVNKDTDGDGLLDSWEIKGYDHDGNGTIDVNLPALGANYKKKDIFIAYAWMEKGPDETKSHQPTAAILKAVTDAFARAPVSNPDGSKGITVHWLNLGSIPYQANLDISNTNWAVFDTIMDAKVSAAKRKIYHRLINGRGYDGGNSSGISRGIPASDFIETLHSNATTAQRAGTIMHELGHNLGLHHGGVDDQNYKPNHLSIMSYSNQFDWLIRSGQPYLDYERFNLQSLNEMALNEKTGLNVVSGSESTLALYGVRWFVGGNLKVKTSRADTLVDWSGNGNPNQTSVAIDINKSGGRTTLKTGFVEWTHLIFTGGQIGASAGKPLNPFAGLAPDALKELSLEEHLRTKSTEQVVK